MFNAGEYVYYKKYLGKIVKAYENKTCYVELYNYRGFTKIIKQIDNYEIFPAEIPLPI